MTSTEQLEMDTLWEMLNAPDSPPKTRYQAAVLLLAKTHPRAGQILLEALSSRRTAAASAAVAQAVAETNQCRPAFIEPLFVLLTENDEQVRLWAAAALSTSHQEQVLGRLCAISEDTAQPAGTRTAAISALARMLDDPSIEMLIHLLDDKNPDVRLAAAGALARLTGIHAFGSDSASWQAWWGQNKAKPHERWLADLAEGLADQNAALQTELAACRRRLADSMRAGFESIAPAKRGEMIASMLQDPLAEVRLLGLELATRQINTHEPVSASTALVVRAMVDDGDPSVRAAAAMLLAGLQLPQADAALLARLKTETAPEVRAAIVKSLAAMKAAGAFEVVLSELAVRNDIESAAAAVAIARLSESTAMNEAQVAQAASAIMQRYNQTENSGSLRAALLAAMRALNRPEFAQVIRAALTDKSPEVRLEAVRALAVIRSASADELTPLTQDSDRGVRQAAMETLAVIADARQINVVLERTASVEADPAVRQKAWETALALLEKADTERVAAVARLLAGRTDAREYRIRVLTMLVERLHGDPAACAAAQAELGELLLSADQPARAAETLAAAMSKTPSDRQDKLWLLWIDALLRADDPNAVSRIAEQHDSQLFSAAVDKLHQRLDVLQISERYAAAIALADGALKRLGDRLGESVCDDFSACRQDADRRGRAADGARVAALVKTISGTDITAADQARRELLAMGKRAAAPLVELLRTSLADDTTRVQMEKILPSLLAAIDGRFAGYDPAAPLADRMATVEGWMQKVQQE